MMKSLLVGTAALAIAGSSLVYAQQRAPQGGAEAAPAHHARHDRGHARHDRGHARPTAEDFSAFADARVAALKAGLKLTPEQEKNWPAVETAVRDLAKQRGDRMRDRAEKRDERRNAQSTDMIERLRQRADRMTESAGNLKRLADASEPLYKSLDDGQKRRLAMLSRNLGGNWRGMHPQGRPN